MDGLDWVTIVVSACLSALVSLIVTSFSGRHRSWSAYRKLRLEPDERFGTLGVVRVINDYYIPLRNVYAYITVEHNLEDVYRDPPNDYAAYIHEPNIKKLVEDRLCWSIAYPEENPPVIDILPGEHQALSVVKVNYDKANPDKGWMEIPSERGFSSFDDDPLPERRDSGEKRRISRVFLTVKKYKATIKIVSFDTKAKDFRVEIDPFDKDFIIRLL